VQRTVRSRALSPDDSIDAVLVASRALVGVAARSLAATEDTITLVQYRTLVLLGSRGEMKVGSVAVALNVHQSTATRLCDRLVAKGLVSRRTSEVSRREVFIALTPAGSALIRTVTTRRRREIAKIMDRLPRTERARLAEAFLAFADAAGEVPDEAWKLGWTA
jgi:DNA-binding MarR family transcriptional regulator